MQSYYSSSFLIHRNYSYLPRKIEEEKNKGKSNDKDDGSSHDDSQDSDNNSKNRKRRKEVEKKFKKNSYDNIGDDEHRRGEEKIDRIVDLDTGKVYKIPLAGPNSSKPNAPQQYDSPAKPSRYPAIGTAESTPARERDRDYQVANGKYSTPERTNKKRSQKDSPDFMSPVTPGTAYTGYSRSVLDSAVGAGPPLHPRPGPDKFSPPLAANTRSNSSPHTGAAITLSSLEDHMGVRSDPRRGGYSQEKSSNPRGHEHGFSPQQIIYDPVQMDGTPSALSRSGSKNTRRKSDNREKADRDMCIENSRGASNYVRREDGSAGWADTPTERRRKSADDTPSPNKRERKKKTHEYSPSEDRQGHGHKGTIAEKQREDRYIRTSEMNDSPQTHTDLFMQRQRAERQAEFDRRVSSAVAVSQGQKTNNSPPIGDLSKSAVTPNTNTNKISNSTPPLAPKSTLTAQSRDHPQGYSRPYRDQGTPDYRHSPQVPKPLPASTSMYSTPDRNGRGSFNNSPSTTTAAAASVSRATNSNNVPQQVLAVVAAAADAHSPVVSRIVNGWHTSYSQPGQYGQQHHTPR